MGGRTARGAARRASLVYEVATGMLAPDTRFAPPGHALVLRVNGAFGGE